MKKNIEYASIDVSLLGYIIDRLNDATGKNVNEIKNQLIELKNGNCNSLILELSSDSEKNSYSDSIIYNDLEIIPRYRRVVINKEEIALTPKEYDILYFLASNKGIIYTKEQIYQAVWCDEYLMDDSNIMAFIRKLRKKIEADPCDPKYIITVWGIGYKFNDK